MGRASARPPRRRRRPRRDAPASPARASVSARVMSQLATQASRRPRSRSATSARSTPGSGSNRSASRNAGTNASGSSSASAAPRKTATLSRRRAASVRGVASLVRVRDVVAELGGEGAPHLLRRALDAVLAKRRPERLDRVGQRDERTVGVEGDGREAARRHSGGGSRAIRSSAVPTCGPAKVTRSAGISATWMSLPPGQPSKRAPGGRVTDESSSRRTTAGRSFTTSQGSSAVPGRVGSHRPPAGAPHEVGRQRGVGHGHEQAGVDEHRHLLLAADGLRDLDRAVSRRRVASLRPSTASPTSRPRSWTARITSEYDSFGST